MDAIFFHLKKFLNFPLPYQFILNGMAVAEKIVREIARQQSMVIIWTVQRNSLELQKLCEKATTLWEKNRPHVHVGRPSIYKL